MGSFGVSLPVVALNNGFLGAVSRVGYPVIAARQVLSTTANPINFGAGVVAVAGGANGDYAWQSIADFIAGGGTFTAAKFAGVAVREVKTNLAYVALESIPANLIGSYAQGEMAEVLESGSVCVQINNGTPVSQGPVYVRTVANGTIPAGVVGGFEAVNDNAVNTTAAAATTNSTTLTVSSATGIAIGQLITGIGIPANTYVTNVVGTTLTLSNAATVGSAAALNFSNTTALVDVVFRTGNLDANSVAEITILNRIAA